MALNNAGQVTGNSNVVGNAASHAFSWDSVNATVDLGTLGGAESTAYGINASGVIVGYSPTAPGFTSDRPFRWTLAGGMVNLGTVGGNARAAAINDAGASVGTCLACTKASCGTQLAACNADCDCKNVVAGFFDCIQTPGGSLLGCAMGLGSNASAQSLGLCVYTGCKSACGVATRPSDGGSDADAD